MVIEEKSKAFFDNIKTINFEDNEKKKMKQ